MIDVLVRYLRADGASLLGNDGYCRSLRVLKASGAPGWVGRVSFFVFRDTEVHPCLVCRVPRHPSGEESLHAEWAVRQEIYTRLPPTLKASVPMLLALERLQGTAVLIEQGLSGTALFGRFMTRFPGARRRIVNSALNGVAAWITSFQHATEREQRVWTLRDEEEHVFHAFSRAARWLRPESRAWLSRELSTHVRALRGAEIVWAAQHGDLWPGNILAGPRGLAVVDWEVARCAAPTFVDPLLFVLFYLFGDRLSIGRSDWYSGIRLPEQESARAFVAATVRQLAADHDKLRAAFLVSVLSRCHHHRLREGPPRELRVLVDLIQAPELLTWLAG